MMDNVKTRTSGAIKALIVILTILVTGLSVYIIYDKVNNNKTKSDTINLYAK